MQWGGKSTPLPCGMGGVTSKQGLWCWDVLTGTMLSSVKAGSWRLIRFAFLPQDGWEMRVCRSTQGCQGRFAVPLDFCVCFQGGMGSQAGGKAVLRERSVHISPLAQQLWPATHRGSSGGCCSLLRDALNTKTCSSSRVLLFGRHPVPMRDL